MKTLVVTPLTEEHDFFWQSLTQRGYEIEQDTLGRLPVIRFPALGITLAPGGHGKTQFAVQTQHLLDSDPVWDVVVCAGAAGGIHKSLMVGDVVVATTTVEHDFNNKFGTRRYPKFEGATAPLTALHEASLRAENFRVHFGIIASGDEDVVERERGAILHDITGALAVAWEGVGGARACHFSKVPYLEIRGITDNADANAPADFKTNLKIAMNNIAMLLSGWLK